MIDYEILQDIITDHELCKTQENELAKVVELLKSDKLIELPETGIGNLSDGYHTFNELYHHRAVLFSVICNAFKSCAWKSKKHSDGTMYDEMFIVGIDTPEGSATYHYDIEPYWDMFDVKELDNAPEWDGHTPDDAINRIAGLSKSNRLIELPCAVGDTVYVKLASYCNLPYAEAEVRDFTHFTSCGFCVVVTSKHFDKQSIPFSDIGKTVFLTKEEAEAKLKEMEGAE